MLNFPVSGNSGEGCEKSRTKVAFHYEDHRICDTQVCEPFIRFSLQRVDPLVQGRVTVLEDFRLHIINSHL